MPPTEDPRLALLGAIIRDPTTAALAERDWPAVVASADLAPADRDALLRLSPQRVLVYRQLVHNRIANATREFLPRCAARLGPAKFREAITEFVAQRASQSPYLRDVPGEFVRWALTRWAGDRDIPEYLGDLARHELLDFDVRNDPRGGENATGEPLALDRPLRFDGSTRLVRYAFAVHRLSRDPKDHGAPSREDARLLVFRDASCKVRYLELTVFAGNLVEALLVDALPVGDALRRVCVAGEHGLDDQQLADAAHLLADLADRGVVLGAGA